MKIINFMLIFFDKNEGRILVSCVYCLAGIKYLTEFGIFKKFGGKSKSAKTGFDAT